MSTTSSEQRGGMLKSEDEIRDFTDFSAGLSSDDTSWKLSWNMFRHSDGITFYRLKPDELTNLTISFKVFIARNLGVKVFSQNTEAESQELNWMLKNSKLELWSQFYSILDYYSAEPEILPKNNSTQLIRQALDSLHKISRSREISCQIDFIKTKLTEALIKSEETGEDYDNAVFEVESDWEESNLLENEEDDDEEEDEDDEDDEDFELPARFPVEAVYADIEDEKPTKKRKKEKDKKISREKKQTISWAKRTKEADGVYACEHCPRTFETSLQLKNHFFNSHDGPVFCDKCGKQLASRKSLAGHMLRHEENPRVKCPQCDIMLLPESLRRHIKTRHQGYKPHPCSICGKCFTAKKSVRDHEKIHLKKQETRETQRIHGIEFRVTEDFKYECRKCMQLFERGTKVFEDHMETCLGVKVEKKRPYRYPCLVCQKKFMSKVTCAEHMALTHNWIIENVEKFCFECKAEFDNPMMHAQSHNCNFPCNQCSFRFTTQEKLDNHIADKHPSGVERPFPCDLCPARFKTANHLRSHKTSCHLTSEEKQFVCTLCNKRYGFQYELNCHLRSAHSDVKRFACNYCGTRFKKLSVMKDHCKRVHGEDSPYPCSDCPVKVKTLNDLKNHRQDQHGVSINVQKYHEA